MAYLKWTKNLDTGIEVIDGQHRQIVAYINQIHDAKLSQNHEAISKVLGDTIEYTVSHFGFEETLLEDARYEFIRPHKKVHELFIKRVSEYKQRFDSGEDVAEELHGLLSRWLFSHILNDDAAYVPSVKASLKDFAGNKQKQGLFKRSLSKFFG
ncbi:MAG: bacteriohemerythrin [Candidatus Thiodiazotropha sp.]|jgi:hemerythrin